MCVIIKIVEDITRHIARIVETRVAVVEAGRLVEERRLVDVLTVGALVGVEQMLCGNNSAPAASGTGLTKEEKLTLLALLRGLE